MDKILMISFLVIIGIIYATIEGSLQKISIYNERVCSQNQKLLQKVRFIRLFELYEKRCKLGLTLEEWEEFYKIDFLVRKYDKKVLLE